MKAASIPRMKFREDMAVEDERVKLAKNASSKLGYHKLANAIALPGALLFKLRELGIEPLDSQQVNAYKKSKETRSMYSGTKKTIMFILGLIACVSNAIGLDCSFPGDHAPGWAVGLFVACILGGIACGISVIVCFVAEQIGQGTRTLTFWDGANISSYSGSIPEHALSKALEIREAIPTASFTIEYLIEDTETKRRPLPDPFLLVTYGQESYFIDVWDEKEYKF